MNLENIFTILLFLKPKIINISIKYINFINNKYLWKLIYIRKYKTNYIIKSYTETYILFTNMEKISKIYFQNLRLLRRTKVLLAMTL